MWPPLDRARSCRSDVRCRTAAVHRTRDIQELQYCNAQLVRMVPAAGEPVMGEFVDDDRARWRQGSAADELVSLKTQPFGASKAIEHVQLNTRTANDIRRFPASTGRPWPDHRSHSLPPPRSSLVAAVICLARLRSMPELSCAAALSHVLAALDRGRVAFGDGCSCGPASSSGNPLDRPRIPASLIARERVIAARG